MNVSLLPYMQRPSTPYLADKMLWHWGHLGLLAHGIHRHVLVLPRTWLYSLGVLLTS